MLYEKMEAFMEKYVYSAEQVSGISCAMAQTCGIFDLKKGFPLTLVHFHEQEIFVFMFFLLQRYFGFY